ncbi:MAG TPA: (2Fe-2S)-binding protein [Acetobacteraceae bacterium]|jgi:carbon-monoxide dehydrogenase small subunit|nr:(2Fe-2S)-binding protein [Acetobacteraceae bacterium]
MSKIVLELHINGEAHEVLAEPHWTLLDVLRGPLGLLGTKVNCLEAECGVCTVLLDGKAVNSCILLAVQCRGRRILTIEGIGRPGKLHPLQQAFIDHGAAQCGYCIPGMLLTAKSYLDEHPGVVPGPEAVREAIAGTLCRCTGYQKIVDAIRAAAVRMKEPD